MADQRVYEVLRGSWAATEKGDRVVSHCVRSVKRRHPSSISSCIQQLLRQVEHMRHALLRRSHKHAMPQVQDVPLLTRLG